MSTVDCIYGVYVDWLLQDPDLVLHTCQGVLTSVLSNLEQEPFMNVEVVLRVFYMLGEVITDKVCMQFLLLYM